MTEFLRNGLEGRSLKATLWMYLCGILLLAPVGILVAFFYGASTSFRAAPVLVLILVLIEYAIAYSPSSLPTLFRRSKTLGIVEESFGRSLWVEFRPILGHGCITALVAIMIATVQWLFYRVQPAELDQTLHGIDRILFLLVFVYFAIATITELLISLVARIRRRTEELVKRLDVVEGETPQGEASVTITRRLTKLPD